MYMKSLILYIVEEKPAEVDPIADDPELRKKSLLGFIFALVGLALCETVIGGIVFGALGLKFSKAAAAIEKKPFSVFNKVSKPVGIVAIILGTLFVIFWIVYFILIAIGVVAGAMGY